MNKLPQPTTEKEAYQQAQDPSHDWVSVCAGVAARAGVKGDVVRAGSGSLVVCFVGDGHVVKLYPPIHRETRVRETAALSLAAGLPVPRIVGEFDVEGWTALLMTRVPGVALDVLWPQLSPFDRVRLAGDVGRFVRRLHTRNLFQADVLTLSWKSHVQRCCAGLVETQRARGLEEPWLAQLPELIATLRPLMEAQSDLVLLHTELGPGHVLVKSGGGGFDVGGVIDFGDALVGPAMMELSAMLIFVTRGDRLAVRAWRDAVAGQERGADDEGFVARVLASALLHPYCKLSWYLDTARASVAAPPFTTWWDVARFWAGVSFPSS